MHWTVKLVGGPKRVNHAAASVGHHIYSFGGYNKEISYVEPSPISIYDLNTVNLRWTEIEVDPENYDSCPFERYGLTAVAYGTDIIIWGGRNDLAACNRVYFFDTLKKEWRCPKVTGAIPRARDGHSACIINHRMYIFGGFIEDLNAFCSDAYYLDLKTMEWVFINVKEGEIQPPGRDFHSAAVIGSRMYIIGGRGNTNSSANASPIEKYWGRVYYLDYEDNKWHILKARGTSNPVGRRSLSTFVHNDCIYMFGGCNGVLRNHFNDICEFNPMTRRWKTIKAQGTYPVKRRRQCCVLIGERAYIFGGSCPKIFTGGAEYSLPQEYLEYPQSHTDLDDLDDLFVLQMGVPSLKTLCCMEVIKHNLRIYMLPQELQYDILAMSTPNNIILTDSHPPSPYT